MGLATSGRSLVRAQDPAIVFKTAVVGVSESFAGGVMGFATLSLVALITAAAFWRGTPLD